MSTPRGKDSIGSLDDKNDSNNRNDKDDDNSRNSGVSGGEWTEISVEGKSILSDVVMMETTKMEPSNRKLHTLKSPHKLSPEQPPRPGAQHVGAGSNAAVMMRARRERQQTAQGRAGSSTTESSPGAKSVGPNDATNEALARRAARKEARATAAAASSDCSSVSGSVPGVQHVSDATNDVLARRAARKAARASKPSTAASSVSSSVADSVPGIRHVSSATSDALARRAAHKEATAFINSPVSGTSSSAPGVHHVSGATSAALSRRAARKEAARLASNASDAVSVGATPVRSGEENSSTTRTARERFKGVRGRRQTNASNEDDLDNAPMPSAARRGTSKGDTALKPNYRRGVSIGSAQQQQPGAQHSSRPGHFSVGEKEKMVQGNVADAVDNNDDDDETTTDNSDSVIKALEKHYSVTERRVTFDSAPPENIPRNDPPAPPRPPLSTDPEKNLALTDKDMKQHEKVQAMIDKQEDSSNPASEPPALVRNVPLSVDPAAQKHLVGAVRHRGINATSSDRSIMSDHSETTNQHVDAYTRFAHTPCFGSVNSNFPSLSEESVLRAPVIHADDVEMTVAASTRASSISSEYEAKSNRLLCRWAVVMSLVALVAVGVVVGVLIGGGSGDKKPPPAEPIVTMAPSAAPTVASTPFIGETMCAQTDPSRVADTSPRIKELEQVLPIFANSTQPNSPQRKALCWLALYDGSRNITTSSLQRFSLVSLFYSLSSPAQLSNWVSETDECTWLGVGCYLNSNNDKIVSSLQFVDKGLNGTIPVELGDIRTLELLDIHDNAFTGSIPSNLWSLTLLTHLSLHQNGLTGNLLSQIGQLTSLRELDLSINNLNGIPPVELFSLPLRILNLDSNDFTGTVHSALGTIASLAELVLSNNRFTGQLPTEIGLCTNLYSVDLSTNMMQTTIPTEIGRLTKLRSVVLSTVRLVGSIPSEIGNLTILRTVTFSGNRALEGTIPTELGRLTLLQSLVVDGTFVSGTMPQEVCNLRQAVLSQLDASCRNFVCDCCTMCSFR